jgi:hypothetical protein
VPLTRAAAARNKTTSIIFFLFIWQTVGVMPALLNYVGLGVSHISAQQPGVSCFALKRMNCPV